jgi:hypothetical protein
MSTLVMGAFGCIRAWVIIGPRPRTGLADGIQHTLAAFAALRAAGQLHARELDPPRA